MKAPRNRSIEISKEEMDTYKESLQKLSGSVQSSAIENTIINDDLFNVMDRLPEKFVDLLFLDPPYNLSKSFNGRIFKGRSTDEYGVWLDSWLSKLIRTLKPNASVYICGDWRSSAAIQLVAEKYLIVRNRITWEREKGRGALSNWKSCSEDIWFCTTSENFVFNVGAVKLKRRVIAPYKDDAGAPKDWKQSEDDKHRLTYPSNLWTDITVPFWSMPENTQHPTQKPEKLMAKVILASSLPGDLVFDPFLGSGTTAVVAKKLGRKYLGIEIDPAYCCMAQKRLVIAEKNTAIQGYKNGVFWERNSLQPKKAPLAETSPGRKVPSLFDHC